MTVTELANKPKKTKYSKILVPSGKAILVSEENFEFLEHYKDETDYTLSNTLNSALDELRALKKEAKRS